MLLLLAKIKCFKNLEIVIDLANEKGSKSAHYIPFCLTILKILWWGQAFSKNYIQRFPGEKVAGI
jgi:hypothetical protein